MTLRSGDVFASRFRIDRAAGAGGMGTVYRARDQLRNDIVALKLLHDQGTPSLDSDRFDREAQLLSELHHPGIVSYIAHGNAPMGQRFLAMQWLDGEDLAHRLCRGPLPLGAALNLTLRIAEALCFAHSHGVVHRDLKPQNIFLLGGDLEQVKLLDFGVARRMGSARAMTRTGMVIGTPEYMAPEQARGSKDAGPAADLFSLGCVLYECLTGEPPFVAEHIAAVLVRILFEEPEPVVQRRPGIPAAVGALLNRLLAKDPSQRMSDAAELIRAISALGELPELPPPSVPVRRTPVHPATGADTEQVLLSLVMAHSMDASVPGNATLPSADLLADMQRHGPLLATLREMGVQAELLLGGAMVVTVPQMASAKDQAAQAARLAAVVRERWPEARVAVVTGRASRSQGGLTGEVLDRAWRLLSPTASTLPSAPITRPQIRIDQVSASLLESRYILDPLQENEEGFALGSERLDPDAGRLLLGKPTPCVGREPEMAVLDAMYSECQEDLEPRAVLVLGPPGLGKSRLRHEFVRCLENQGKKPIVLLGRGDPMKVKSAYGIVGEALRHRLNLRVGEDPAAQRAKIREHMAAALPPGEALRVTVFIGELCGVPFADQDCPQLSAARQDPRVMSDQVERAFLDSLKVLRADQPVLLVLEDLHWSDALTVKLVGAALRRLHDYPLMVLALARPEVHDLYPNLWTGAMVQQLHLHPLARRASERLVRQILGADVPAAHLAQIVEQSTGNPLFLEELIRAMAESKSGEHPPTVMAMIQARLGRLPAAARRLLRAASVFGEMFWENGVQQLLYATHGDAELRGTLEELIREEILERVAEGRLLNDAQYHFRHALVRDAAYGLINEEEKVLWHATAGKFLEDAGEQDAGLLADHYRMGRDLQRAARLYARAAEQTHDSGTMDAALVWVERGLSCGPTGETRGELLARQCLVTLWREQYGPALAAGQEALQLLPNNGKLACLVLSPIAIATMFTTTSKLPELMAQLLRVRPEPAAMKTYCGSICLLTIAFVGTGQRGATGLLRQRARELLKDLTELDHNNWAYYYQMEGCQSHIELKLPYTCIDYFRKAARQSELSGNRNSYSIANTFLGNALSHIGQHQEALATHRAGVKFAAQVSDALQLSYAHAVLAEALAVSADPAHWEEAQEHAQIACQTKSYTILTRGRRVLSLVALLRGDLATAEAEALTACRNSASFPPYRLDATVTLSRVLRAQGRLAEALTACEDILQLMTKLGIEPYALLSLLAELAEVRERLSLREPAMQIVAQALPLLKRRLDDIPEPALRTTYLREVGENVRLLELAKAWGVDTSVLNLGAPPA